MVNSESNIVNLTFILCTCQGLVIVTYPTQILYVYTPLTGLAGLFYIPYSHFMNTIPFMSSGLISFAPTISPETGADS